MTKVNKLDEFFGEDEVIEPVCEEIFIEQLPTEWIEGEVGKHKLNTSILEAAKRLFEEDALVYPVLKITFTKENVTVMIDIRRHKVEYALNKVMDWALSREYYEICQEVKDLSEKYDLQIEKLQK